MPHTEPERPLNTSGTNDRESRTPVFFPPVGKFNAVVPLSELDSDSESRVTAPTPTPLTYSPGVRATARERAYDEQEEATLVPSRAARKAEALRPATRRPSWPVMIAALALSLTAGLAAGAYLIKSSAPVEIQSPASMTQDVAHDTSAAADANGAQPNEVASESRPESRPQAETNEVRPQAETSLDAAASGVAAEVSMEKTSRDLSAPKRVTTADAPPGRVEHFPETSSARASVVERAPERTARKIPPPSTNTPAPPEALRPRRATPAGEPAPVRRAPERTLPVSSPPSSAKSKRVIQWP